MVISDQAAIAEVQAAMTAPSVMPRHDYSPALAVSLIQNATLCVTMKHHPIIFAMAAAVPTVSMAFDDYYYHKNFGAMSIFHQQEYMLKARPESLSEQLCASVAKVLAEKSEVTAVISQVVEALRPMSGKVIYEFTKDADNGA
jgi:polysaccharide pyruvyl transferase WcaK-like protein